MSTQPQPTKTAAARWTMRRRLTYGTVVGGSLAAMAAGVDVAVVCAGGAHIPWSVPPVIVATCILIGCAVGALSTCVCGLLTDRQSSPGDARLVRRTILHACLSTLAGVYVPG